MRQRGEERGEGKLKKMERRRREGEKKELAKGKTRRGEEDRVRGGRGRIQPWALRVI